MPRQLEADVIVVGSGAAGGMAAYELTAAGLKVLMLEIGRDYDPVTETPMFQTPYQAPLRASITSDKQGGYYDATVDGGWQVPGEPFTVADGSEQFQWWRPRMLGGRTNHWGRVALRFGPYDFKPRQRDGLGFNWPISYDDLAPWYDRVERLIGVTGGSLDLENNPASPPGVLLKPPPIRAHEYFLSAAFEYLGMTVAPIRAAVLTEPINGRAACLYSTQCTRGCSIGANFQSPNVLISPAHRTGRLTTRCNAVVYRVDVNARGDACGVSFVDRKTGDSESATSSTIILAAGTASSGRMLLNSKTPAFPDGIGNSSGFVGKYIMDTVEFTMSSYVPTLQAIPPQNDDGIFTPHIYVPWWLYKEQAAGMLGFPRGYHIEPRGGRRMPTSDLAVYIDSNSAVYGSALFDEIRRRYGSYLQLSGEGEMIPNDNCYFELDPTTRDKWGFPVLRFNWKWADSEQRQVAHMHSTFNEVFRLLGGVAISGPPQMPIGGGANHMVGGTRMGDSPSNSVVNEFGECWDVPNLFVIDGGIFVSSPDKNPTLTILALASRTSAHIATRSRSCA